MLPTYRRPVVALVGLSLLSHAPVAAAQSTRLDCDPSVRPIAGGSGYDERIGDPRCEGFFQSPVSATGLEVVSVTLGPLTFDIKTDDELVVSLPDLGELDPEAIRVRAVALPLRMYYRMDTLLAPGRTMRWPVGAVIRPWDLTDARLGAFGSIDRNGERIMIPVAVAAEDEGSTDAAGNVLIKLRSAVRLERLLWRAISPDGSVSDWQPVVERSVQGGEAIPFALPAGPPGVVHLDFRAKRANSDEWLALDLNVWRPAE
jgi:hypothetical protein